MVITTLVIGLLASVPFGVLCLTVSKYVQHRIDIEDRRLKIAMAEASSAAWEEFDVKYRERFEYDAGRQ